TFVGFAIGAILRWANIGLKILAVADSAELAFTLGVSKDSVILAACCLGSGVAALTGILIAFDVQMTPTMGMRPLMMGIVVVIVGGSDSILGIALAALLLGSAQQFAAWWLPAQWQDCVAFVILVLSLVVKAQGFLSNLLWKAKV
ncbi:MAG: ABC transporter permease subunit, partial [Limisphaerales bacterium]